MTKINLGRQRMKRPRLIVVDDNRMYLSCLEDFFKHHGIEVHPVNGADEALKVMQVRKFDLLLTDIQMPVMDGVELAKMVRGTWPEMPIIMHTANLTSQHYNLAEILGVSRVLDKSASPQELVGVIRQICL